MLLIDHGSTLILMVFPLHQIAHIGVSPEPANLGLKLFGRDLSVCDV